MIDQAKARALAERYLDLQPSNGYTYAFVNVSSPQPWRNEWNVVFNLYSPEGGVIDGPAVILVDKVTGDTRVL